MTINVMMENSRDQLSAATTAPHPHHSTAFCPDPDLGLTPERSPSQLSKKTVRFISPTKPKARRKVELLNKENVDLSRVELSSINPHCGSVAPNKSSGRSKQHRKLRKPKTNKTLTERHDITSNPSDNTSEEIHLDRPELHTTLNLGRDMLRLQTMDIDIVEAVKHRLTVSERDRTHVQQRTLAKLNERPKSPSAFGEAISLNVPADVVIGQTERQMSRAVRPLTLRNKPDGGKPSLSRFYRRELIFHRCVSFNQHGYQPRALHIAAPPIDQAVFEHHNRISSWESG